jgi:hypothetical protein
MATGSIALVGTVKRVEDLVKVSERFQKRVIVVTIDEDTEYPQDVAVEFVNDKTGLIGKYSAGDKVTVDVNIRGKDFEKDDKISNFTKMNGWRIKGFAAGGNDPAPQGDVSDMPGGNDPAPQQGASDGGADDLPF